MTDEPTNLAPDGNGFHAFFKRKGIKTIGIAYSKAERSFFPTEEAYISEAEVLQRALTIQKILENTGFEIKLYPGDEKLLQQINNDQPDLILNLVDTVRGVEFLGTTVPASLDLAQIPYTGSGMYPFILSANKALIKEILIANDIPTPQYQLVKRVREPISKRLRYPLITKLNNYNGSVGITNDAISDNEKHLRKRLSWLLKTYKSPVIVEEFIDGKELSAIVIEGRDKKSVYIGEKVFTPTKKRKYDFCSFEATWIEENSWSYKKYDKSKRKIARLARKAFDLMDMADYAKFDIRISKKDKPYFTDCNPNPALGPAEADCAIGNITKLYGISFKQALLRIMKNALVNSKYSGRS
jgi:D-alanine-D-alanine ligase